MNLQNQSIKLLPEFLIDQIKAGEIIERPSYLIKEIIENSLDAKASKIEIHLIENGLKQITIRDNGEGILFEDLPYAFCRHATSKIKEFQDLYNLGSFGFRGEALASIAAIAQVNCVSRCTHVPEGQNPSGGHISLIGGQTQDHMRQEDLPYGTLLVIKDLFFNTPVRLNFIKSQTAEKNSLLRILHSFLISHPQIEFHLKWDREEKKMFRPTNRFERFTQVLSGNRWAKDDFCFLQKNYENYQITGLYSKFSKKSGQGKNQYLFVNKRLVQDQALRQIILSALENQWPQGGSGPYLLDLDIPKGEVDVNVHPNKTMVKFARPSLVHSLVYSSLKEVLSSHKEGPSSELKDGESGPINDVNKSPLQSYEHRHPGPLQSMAIGHRYQLFPQEDNFPFIVDSTMLIRFHLEAIKAQFEKDKRIPLLVGVPFRNQKIISQIRQHDIWEKYHFEFDQLKDDLMILRAIPHSLGLLPPAIAIFHLLGEWERFEEILKNGPLPPQALYDLFKAYPLERLIQSKCVFILNPESLTKLFH